MDNLYWERCAREIMYPDLRLGWKQHDKMLRTLTTALKKCGALAAEGGGGRNRDSEHIPSIFDATAGRGE